MITSLQSPKVKQLVRLKDRKERDVTDLFLIEGYRELLRAVGGSFEIISLYICPDFFLGSNEEHLIRSIKGEVIPCSAAVFQKISYRDRPDGLLAVAKQEHKKLSSLKFRNEPFLVACEAIEKPGNLGTILRSSDASGADGLIVCDQCTDLFNPNTVRASVGTLFTVPVVEASSDETIKFLKKKGIQIVAATPSGEKEYTKVDMTKGVAIAVGTEQLGLSDKWMDEADLKVRIPMMGVADSLNVASATTLLLYEVLRQRS